MDNPGSVFQAFALQKYLDNYGNTTIIDYRPSYFYREKSKLKYFLKKVLFYKDYASRRRKFDSFINDNMKLTNRFNEYDELCDSKISADIFVVGSDQLWNTDYDCGEDPAFYLKFIDNGYFISYATSIGKNKLSKKDITILTNELDRFKYLSVRENSNAQELSDLLHRPVAWVCDPVFLLNPSVYIGYINKRICNDNYVVVYLSESSAILDSIVEYYKSCGKKIILLGGFTKRCNCDIHVKDAGPLEFLNYIYYADAVVSSSFHATAFSIIFQKEFLTILPKYNGERILSILRLCGISERAVKDLFDENTLKTPINWDIVKNNLNSHVLSSKEYLKIACNKKGEL